MRLVYPLYEGTEDAIILFAFAKNLAQTGVISYYAGGIPAEGTTDFLWMVLLVALYKLCGLQMSKQTVALSLFFA